MFPTVGLPKLPTLPGLHSPDMQAFAISLPGGGGGGIGFPGGGISIGMPPISIGLPGGGSSGGGATSVSLGGAVGGALSSVLGIPAINWGRLAAFILGLILIAGGIYLIKPVQQVVNTNVKAGAKALLEE